MAGAPAPLRLAVFDARRGNKEGREHEKMLCYFPSSTPVPAQVNHVGFAQACSMFAEHFTAEVSSARGWWQRQRSSQPDQRQLQPHRAPSRIWTRTR